MNYCDTKEDFIKYAERLYESHRRRKAGELPEPIDMCELMEMKFPKEVTGDAESDYRRGFDHGFCYASELVFDLHRKGYSRPREIFNILFDFEETTLRRWRHDARDDVNDGGERCKFTEGHPLLEIEKWKDIREKVFNRDFRRCLYCGSDKGLECDHIVPVFDGGTPKLENLQTLCAGCNQSKGHLL